MKKLLLISIIFGALPIAVMAQDDDLYFVPKKGADKATEQYGLPRKTYYEGTSRSVDDYNRRGSHYESIDVDSLTDVIDFSAVTGVYPDSIYDTSDDFKLTREMSRFDGYTNTDAYRDGYAAGVNSSLWHSPWYYSRYGWYDPWYSWHDPWYYGSYGWGWYDPWYYGVYWLLALLLQRMVWLRLGLSRLLGRQICQPSGRALSVSPPVIWCRQGFGQDRLRPHVGHLSQQFGFGARQLRCQPQHGHLFPLTLLWWQQRRLSQQQSRLVRRQLVGR